MLVRSSMVASLAAVLLFPSSALGQDDDPTGWRLRVDFAVVDPAGSDRVEVSGGTVRTEFDKGAGFGVRGEYQFSERIGIDFGFLGTASVDVSTSSRPGRTSVDINSFSPFTVGADFHLTPGRRVDLYLGPMLALVRYGDIEVRSSSGGSTTSVSVDNDLGLGAILGLDVPLGERRRWSFQTSLRYLKTSMESDGEHTRVDLDFDPVIFSVGFGHRW